MTAGLDLEAVTHAFSPAQIRSVVEAQNPLNIWEGSIRSGKTIASLVRWLIYVANPPRGGDLVVVGKTRETIGRNVFAPLSDPALFGDIARHVDYTPGAPTGQILGRTIHVLGANDSKSEPKVRGMTCAGAYCDEVTVLPRSFFDQLVGRMSVPGAKLFGTTNPDNPSHWLRKEYLLRPAETGCQSWHFTLDDNPHLDPAYVARIKSTYTGLWYRRFISGEWVQAEGAVYDCWDPDRHVVDILPTIIRWIGLGVDYGTSNPFAALLLGLGVDGRLYLTREWRYNGRASHRQLTDVEYSARLREWLAPVRPEWTCVDPSAASFITQLYRDGLTPTAAANSVLDGIRQVASLLASGLLLAHRSCTGWIEEMPGYSWDEDASAKGEDRPIKADDHSLDAGRYAVHTTEAAWRPLLAREAA
ncbi:MAG TPA: PBSX family phage terminase large subunit [Mycobacteriales bacterium]|jgi:phage terminase, large subunit, PBSX family